MQEWQPRSTAALRLAERVRELLPEAGQRRDELSVALDRAYRAVSAVQLPARPDTLEQMEAAAPVLATVTERTALLEAAIGAVLTVTIDRPLRQTTEAVAALSAEALRLLPYAGDQQEALDQQLRQAQPSLTMPPLLAPQPAGQESVTEVSSAQVTLDRLRNSIPGFTAAVAAALQAGWQPRVDAVTGLAEQARALLGLAGDQLPHGRGQVLAGGLEAAERNLVSQAPPAARAGAGRGDGQGQAGTGQRDRCRGGHQGRARRGAGQAGTARGLGPGPGCGSAGAAARIPGDHAALGAEVAEAERQMRDIPEVPAEPLTTAEHLNAAQQELASVDALEAVTRRLLSVVTGAHDALRPRVDAAGNLAAKAQAALRPAGGQQDSLGQQLDAATARLRRITPGWWTDSGTALETVSQVEAAVPALTTTPAEFENAAKNVERIATDVLAAAVLSERETQADAEAIADVADLERADALLGLTERVRDLVGYTTQPDSLRTSLIAAERDLAQARHLPHQADNLQAAMEAVVTEATEGLPDRVTAARALLADLGEELPLTWQQREDLEILVGRRQDPRGVVAASPDIGAALAAVRQGMTALTALETAARQGIDQAALSRRAQAALALAQAAQRLPIPGGEPGRT